MRRLPWLRLSWLRRLPWLRRLSRMPRLRLARLRWLWGLRWLWLLLAVGTLPHLLTAGLIPTTLKSNTLWPG